MEFYNLLMANGTARAAAQSFVRHMLEAANASDNWWPEVTRIFVTQCFRAAGLRCNVTAEQLRVSRKFDWRKDNLEYVFLYNPYHFSKVEKLLESLSDIIEQSEEARTVQINKGDCHAALPVSPLMCYIIILRNWFEVVQHVCCPNDSFTWACDRFYREPMSRLCYYILRGLVQLEHKYGAQHANLTDLCTCMIIPVSFGLYFKETHNDILNGMLTLTERYHELFYSEQAQLWRFLYYALICESKTASALIVYEHLNHVIYKWVNLQMRCNDDALDRSINLRLLTNNLINKNLMCVYYATLNSQNTKTVLEAVLNFLDTLQRHIITAECFTKDFLSVLLLLVIKHNTAIVRGKAARLYVCIASRLKPEGALILHIMEVFVKSPMTSLPINDLYKHLFTYVREFEEHLPAIKEFSYYKHIIFEGHSSNNDIVVMAAHMMVIIFKLYQAGTFKADGCKQVVTLICDLPMILDKANSQTRFILFNIFFELDCAAFIRDFIHARERLSALEDFGLLLFLNDEFLEDSNIQEIFDSVVRFVNSTGNVEKLVKVGSTLNIVFKLLEDQLIAFERDKQSPSDMLFEHYYRTLRRLNYMLQANQSQAVNLDILLNALCYRFLPDCMYNESTANLKLRIDHDAYEVIAITAILLRNDEDVYDGARLHTCVLHAVKAMRTRLMQTNTKEIKRCQSLFNALAMLLVGFATPNSHGQLRLTQRTYSILLGTLCCVLQPRGSKADAAKKEHVSLMLLAFNRLLGAQNIELPNHTIWKLMLHYPTARQFNKEQEMLIATLLKKQLSNYMRALPVFVYKLHVQQPPLPDLQISRALKAHITLITQLLRTETSLFLLLHGFLVTLEILLKMLSITTPRVRQNRLLTLKHVSLFVKQMHLSDAIRKNIDNVTSKLDNSSLSAEEQSTLLTFRQGLQKNLSRPENTSATPTIEGEVEAMNTISPTLPQNGDQVLLESAMWTLAHTQYLKDIVSSAVEDDNVHVASQEREEGVRTANQAAVNLV